VQGLHDNDLAKLLDSGFAAVSTNNVPAPLATPDIVSIRHGHSGQLNPRLTPIPNARAYELRYAHVPEGGPPGPWQSGGLYSATRTPLASGLTPGAVYQFQARAIGGSTGASDWGSTVSQRTL